MTVSENIEFASHFESDLEAYDYLESCLKPGCKFYNKFKTEFKFGCINRFPGSPPRIQLYRESGSAFTITYFKFKRNFKRGNWRILTNEYRSYQRKKLIIK